MKPADQILRLLRDRQELLDEFGVQALFLFGSCARGESSADSDIDLLVEFREPVGLFCFAGLKLRLEELLGAKVDLVERDALHPSMKDSILAEAIRAA